MASTEFITEDFLLGNSQAVELYQNYAKDLPIVDYHCHLPVEQIGRDERWENMAQIWLYGDHYKWRAMRANGVDERYCTGGASDWEKFEKFAATMGYLLRNPLYHWSHMELKRYFGVSDRLLGPTTAKRIWEKCNERIGRDDFSARSLIKQSKVVLLCTTDDPIDSLEHHESIGADASFDVQVLPAWRPDKGMAVENPAKFGAWVGALGQAADVEISDFESYIGALRKRHDFFHERGCRLSDHGIDTIWAEDYTAKQIAGIFQKVRSGSERDAGEVLKFKAAMLYEFGVMDC